MGLPILFRGVRAAVWTTPLDTVSMGPSPELKFTMPALSAPMFFHMQLDTAATFDTGNLREIRSDLSQTGWAYWNGSSWVAVPGTGVPASFGGFEARHTIQVPLTSTTWFRRVRGGT
jgi:hypothetical protein